MADINLNLILKGVTDATDAVKKFSKTANDSFEKVSTGFSKIGNVAIIAAVGVAFGKMISAAEESEKAIIALNNSLRLTGDFTEETSQGFQDYATALERVTGVSDEAILQQISYVKSLGATNDQATKVTKTALDMAAALGVTLDTAVSQLTGTFAGNVGQLGKQIPELKRFTKEQLAAGDAVEFLSKKFSGSAANSIQGFTGQFTQFKNAAGNVAEALGTVITKFIVFTGVLPALTSGFQFLEDLIQDFPTGLKIIGLEVAKFATAFVDGILRIQIYVDKLLAKIPVIGIAFEKIGSLFEKASSKVEDLGGKIVNAQNDLKKGFGGAADGVDALAEKLKKAKSEAAGLGGAAQKTNEDVLSSIKTLEGQLAGTTLNSQLNSINQVKNARLLAVQDAIDRELISAEQAAEDRSNIEIDAARKTAEARKKFSEPFAKDPVGAAIANRGFDNLEQVGVAGAGVLGSALQGSAGASSLVSGALGAVADSVVPGLGGVVSQIASVLAQGPEAAKAFVNGFVDALPTVIQAIIDSIPVVIQTLVDRAPDIITALTLAIPKAANTLALELGLRAPDIARDFAVAFVKEGIPQIVKGFLDEIKKGFDTLNPFGGGGIGGGLGDLQKTISTGGLNKIFGFASGGIVPGNGNVDKVPALLTPGEAMIDTSVSGRLLNFLDSFEREQSQSNRGGTQNLTVNFVMDKQVLASQLIEIDRDGIRTTA